MEDKDGNITFAATGETLKAQEYFLKTQNKKYSLPHHSEHNDLKGGFAPEFIAKRDYMIKLIEATENKEPIETDKGDER